MFKLFAYITLLSIQLYSATLYSLQIATFRENSRAVEELTRLSKSIDELFLYQTDRGYWTIRYGKESSRNEAKALRGIDETLKYGVVVPSDSSKLFNNQKKVVEKRVKEPEVLDQKEAIPPLFNRYISQFDNLNIKIDTYTFRIMVRKRVYVIQFLDNLESETADAIFNKRLNKSDINRVLLSNNLVEISFGLGNIEKNGDEIESIILPILNKSRKSQHIRVKAYRVK
jgi:hypothetical protein